MVAGRSAGKPCPGREYAGRSVKKNFNYSERAAVSRSAYDLARNSVRTTPGVTGCGDGRPRELRRPR
jgi:hypothetical protein